MSGIGNRDVEMLDSLCILGLYINNKRASNLKMHCKLALDTVKIFGYHDKSSATKIRIGYEVNGFQHETKTEP